MKEKRYSKQYSAEDSGTTIQLAIASFAIILSLILHFLGIATISDLKISLFDGAKFDNVNVNVKQLPPVEVNIDDLFEQPEVQNIKIAEATTELSDANDYRETPVPVPESVFQAQNLPNNFLPGLGAKTVELDEVDFNPNPELWQPRIEVVEIDRKAVEQIDVSDITRIVVPKIERFENAPDVVVPTAPVAIKPIEDMAMPVFTPSATPTGVAGAAEYFEGTEAAKPQKLVGSDAIANVDMTNVSVDRIIQIEDEEPPPVPIEDVLAPQLTIYRPNSASDDNIYFRVDVARTSETALPVIKRDVLFVQDASESIGSIRIGIVRENLKNLVKALQPTDRFNIMAFNAENALCSQNGWMNANDESSKKLAIDFIDNVKSQGNTDIYRAVEQILDLKTDPNRALIVILFTDGSTNSGKITHDTEIISAFSSKNGGRASVFTVAPGQKGNNDYLLSMLSFLNRGGPATIVKDRFATRATSMKVFSASARPVLTDISFVFSSQSGAEIAPHNTTHLYLDSPLYVFGRVKKNTESIIFQARGKSHGKSYDMVFSMPLTGPDVKIGDATILKEWARARMFDLFAEYDKTKNPILANEMKALAKEYNVSIPFEERIK